MTETLEAPAEPVARAARWRTRTLVVRCHRNTMDPEAVTAEMALWLAEMAGEGGFQFTQEVGQRRDGSRDEGRMVLTVAPRPRANHVPRELMERVRAELLRRIDAGQGEEEIMAALRGSLPLDDAVE
jgi:hypothetical protein